MDADGFNVNNNQGFPRRVPMSKIVDLYNKIREDRRLSTLAVSVLGACLLVVVALFVCMPGLQAAELTKNTPPWSQESTNTYNLASLTDGDASQYNDVTIDVDTGNVYTIKGSSAIERKNLHITFNYKGTSGTSTNPAVVNIVLENVNITQLSDISAISLATSTNAVKFNITINGSCTIKSTCADSTKALIAVESVKYELLKLKQGDNANLDTYVETTIAGNEVSLILCGGNPESELTVQNTAGSMGALIGSSEVNASVEQSNQMMTAIETYYNTTASGSQISATNPVVQSQLVAMGFDPLQPSGADSYMFMPQYKCKNASGFATGNIIIGGEVGSEKPLRLNLSNSGYGASVGSGGSRDTSHKAGDAKSVIINSGTITVYDARTDCNSPVFGSGIAKGATNVGNTYGRVTEIQINGGSIYFGAAQNRFGNVVPVNNLGQKVYQVEAYTLNSATNKSIADIAGMGGGETLPIEYRYDSSLVFASDLNSITSSAVNASGVTNVLDVTLTFSDKTYKYSGTGHRNSGGTTYYSLYFFIPATQTTALTISDEFGPGVVEFTLTESGGAVKEPISTDPSSADSRRYVLERNKIYYLTAANVPDGLSVVGVKLLKEGNESDANYTAGGYTIVADTAVISATVTYGGSIPIEYSAGLISGDEGNHDIVMPTSSYDYGTDSFEIPAPVVNGADDLIFAGWIYTDAAGNEISYLTHIISGTSTDPYKKQYSDVVRSGKIYLKATWKVSVRYAIGDDATVPNGAIDVEVVDYGSGTNNVMDVTLTSKVPQKDLFAFTGWTLDGGTTLYNYTQGGANTIQLSTLTSHVFTANYDRSGFGVYIDASRLNELYADLTCTDNAGNPILVKNGDSFATVVIDGKTYYYTSVVRKDATVRVSIKTKTGYKMSECSVRVTDAASSNVSSDGSAECYADIVIGDKDVYVSTEATFTTMEYKVTFKDGKEPNEYLWGGSAFYYTVEDIAGGKTIGDVIRRGLGKTVAEMPDNDIAVSLNAIDKNTRFTDFSGWNLPLYQNALPMDKTLTSIFAENTSLNYGNLEFTANWTEYDKYAINVTLLEKVYNEEGFYDDVVTDKLVPVLQYYADGNTTGVPVYTEEVTDPVSGETRTIAYAKAGDRIYISLYRKDENGNPVGQPVDSGINIEELYYKYTSVVNEQVRADVTDGSQSFTVKNDVKDDTVINVYMSFTAKQFDIIYWDLRQHDNSANPRKYTIFDEFDFVPIATDVDWLLVCQDTDDTNDDDVTTEVITGIRQDGKLLTNGAAANRDYMSNLILKPDWGDDDADSFSISIELGDTEFGNVSIIYPTSTDGFFENDTIILSVVPRAGYKLVDNSLVYRKNEPQTYSLMRSTPMMTRESNEFIILPADAANGTYLFTMPNSDIIISALFELCEYTITYSDVPSDVTNNNPESYNLYSDITLSGLSRDGYRFLGWYDTEGNMITKIVGRTGDLVLAPRFEYVGNSGGSSGGNTPGPGPITPDNGNTEEPTTPDSGNTEEPTTPANGNTGNTGNSGNINNGGSTGNSKPDNVTISGRPSNIVGRPSGSYNGSVQTGDRTNVPRLVLICVAAVLVLMIVVLKRPGNKDE